MDTIHQNSRYVQPGLEKTARWHVTIHIYAPPHPRYHVVRIDFQTLPNFKKIYAFLGSVFDAQATGHLDRLGEMSYIGKMQSVMNPPIYLCSMKNVVMIHPSIHRSIDQSIIS